MSDIEMTPKEFERLCALGEPVKLARRPPRTGVRENVSHVAGRPLVASSTSALASAPGSGITMLHDDRRLLTV